jgi:hypothetical protein
MKTCPYCAHNNLEGVLYCEECGQVLFGEAATTTSTKKLPGMSGSLDGKNAWGTARFGRDASILIHVRDNSQPIEIVPKEETILGRHDNTSTATPTIDLTPFGAYENGVSRLHAAIRRGEDTLTLVDLGSVNGTHLNGQRLIPNQPRVLRDGDEIRLGKLVCHVFFKTS